MPADFQHGRRDDDYALSFFLDGGDVYFWPRWKKVELSCTGRIRVC